MLLPFNKYQNAVDVGSTGSGVDSDQDTWGPVFPVLRTLEREHLIRCEEYVDGGPYRPGDPGPRGPAAYGSA